MLRPQSRRLRVTLLTMTACLGVLSLGPSVFAQGRKGPVRQGTSADSSKHKRPLLGRKKKARAQQRQTDNSRRAAEPDASQSVAEADRPSVGVPIKENLTSEGGGDTLMVDTSTDGLGPEFERAPGNRSIWEPLDRNGPLGLEDLIRIALHYDPEVMRRYEDIAIEEAAKAAEKDWDDPEIRFAFGRDYDVETGRPYTVTEERIRDSKGRDITNEFARDSIRGNSSSNRNTRNTREFTRERTTTKVTPGIDGDRREEITRTESVESRSDLNRGTQIDSSGFSAPSGSSSSERTKSSTTERTQTFESNAFDPTHPDYGFRIRVRWDLPDFLRMRQRLRQADAEIGIAKVEYEDERRRVETKVTDLYEKVEYLYALDAVDRALQVRAQNYLDALIKRNEENQRLSADLAAGGTSAKDINDYIDRVGADDIESARGEVLNLRSSASDAMVEPSVRQSSSWPKSLTSAIRIRSFLPTP